MPSTHEMPTPAGRGWRYGAIGVVAVMLVGGGWLVAAGLTGQPPAAALENPTPVRSDAQTAAGLGRFAVTPEGAAAAAAAAVAVLGQPEVLFDDPRLDLVAAGLFVAAEVRPQLAEIGLARQGFARSGWDDTPASRRSYFSTPLAVRLTSWTDATTDVPASATVEVWSVTVVTIGDVGGAVYATSTLDLTAHADADDWRISRMDSVEGPTPAVAAEPTIPSAYRLWLRDLVPTVPTPMADVEVGP